jgi:polysaccharide export outer membrane protein
MTKIFTSAATVGILLLIQAASGAAQQTGGPAQMLAPPLRIGAGDLITLSVYDSPDLSGQFRVDEKGDVHIPLLGSVHVEGETAAEAGTTIELGFVKAEILRAPNANVSVLIAEYATQGIVVNGEVKTPGLFPALGVRMLSDVVNAAGGLLPTASSKVLITRKTDPENPITVEYDPDASPPVVPRIQIFPGDTVLVRNAGLVYVLGGVGKAGIYLLERRHTLTVEKAMALAGGSAHGATMNHAHIVRTVDNGKKEDIAFDVNQILKNKTPDIALKDGDIFYIPVSNTKIVFEQAISSAIAVGTTILTYRLAYQ